MATDEHVVVDIEDSLAILTLGHADERVVSFSLRRMESLHEALHQIQQLAAASKIRGVVLRGPTPKMFCAGADLKLLSALQHGDVEQLQQLLHTASGLNDEQRAQLEQLLATRNFAGVAERLSLLGREIFERLKLLGAPTIAAISGVCVGGGLELALHCDFRIAAKTPSIFSGEAKTEIGFPEPLLGLLEGWGGIELTVRRLGLPKALPLLLSGKTISSEQAQRLGLVDEVVEGKDLLDVARRFHNCEVVFHPRQIGWGDRLLTRTRLGRMIVGHGVSLPLIGKVLPGARDALVDYPPQHYPAPHAIVEVAMTAAREASPAAARLASRRFGELAVSPASEALVHVLFFGTEAAKAHAKGAGERKCLQCLVVGAGQMGSGIAHALLRSGQRVLLQDNHAAALAAARSRIEESINGDRRLSASDKRQVLANATYANELPTDLSDVDFAIEAIVENASLKQELFAKLSKLLRDNAVIATNTSSIPISTLATAVASPQRFVGMHYFNPVRQMRLVELIRSAETGDAAMALVASLAASQGKFPVVVRDVPGFLVNRMLFPYLNEAVKLVLEGYDIADIDAAAEKFGMVMGPLKTLDLVGFDIARDAARVLTAAYADRMQHPSMPSSTGGTISWEAVLDELSRRGIGGKKTGRGFYLYPQTKKSRKTPAVNPMFADGDFWTHLGAAPPPSRTADLDALAERLVARLVGEAKCCLDEGVAGDERQPASLQIDLASVLGFGFAPFRGGVIHYAVKSGRVPAVE